MLSAVETCQAALQFAVETGCTLSPGRLMFFQQPQGLAHHLARRGVAAALDLPGYVGFQFRCQRDIHRPPPDSILRHDVHLCQSLLLESEDTTLRRRMVLKLV